MSNGVTIESMRPLDKALRGHLERTVIKAREVAEKGALNVLQRLGVNERAPYDFLRDNERDLRDRLRAHGRQLGDKLNGDHEQSLENLKEEVAYQHWHRMLFARFLAENDLLMYPDEEQPVPVSLKECEELAEEAGYSNGWELAAEYATQMLPQIFRTNSPVFQLQLAPEYQQELEQLLAGLPEEVFTASDSLGWVYQYWQDRKKDEVNRSEVKIGAKELPAVTQLFTEPYMVSFLLDNSLGAWWAARRLTDEDLSNAESEAELRKKASLPEVPLEYLRFVQGEDGRWTPAAGTFKDWPDSLKDLRTLDPCCGSGHFLVSAFLMLVPMRMELEELSEDEAINRVLSENLNGLEIDQRCVEIAAFNLAFTAWRYPGASGYRRLPRMNLACSGLPVPNNKSEWRELGKEEPQLSDFLDYLYEVFRDAPTLGSLIKPRWSELKGELFEPDWPTITRGLNALIEREEDDFFGEKIQRKEMAITAGGLGRAANILSENYYWVITNVPYLSRGKQDELLQEYGDKYHKKAKRDLATMFLDQCLDLCLNGGTVSSVLPQNWLFLTRYQKFREKMLERDTWHLLARLGPGAFETISGEVVKAVLLSISRGKTASEISKSMVLAEDQQLIRGMDVSQSNTAKEKAEKLLTEEIKSVEQSKQLENPDARISFDSYDEHINLLEKYTECYQGLRTGEKEQFLRFFWEIQDFEQNWDLFRNSNNSSTPWGGMHEIILWENGNGRLQSYANLRREKLHDMHESGNRAWGKKGVAINQMLQLKASYYTGEKFDGNVSVIFPNNESHLPAIWCYCYSPSYNNDVRQIDQKLNVTNATLIKVPFDIEHWTKVAEERYPNGLPKPYSDDPTQWIFHGHPCGSVIWDEETKWTATGSKRTDETVLQVAVARLLGYQWPAETDEEMELAEEARYWVEQCKTLHAHTDDDGIVCIPPVRGERKATDRLLDLLADAYGSEWSHNVLEELLEAADHKGKDLESWLRDKFFTQHVKLFHHRPFIWHIWDGLKDGFSALVNYHKLDRKNLENLTYTYLGNWINQQKKDKQSGVGGAEEKLAAAEELQKKLELILEGEKPYDIFVRWKPIEQQPIGWEPDLNDGVRLNIRPFMKVPDIRKKGAGILRDRPNIKWNKDRGKDVESAPWYHLFKGDRINDHYLSLEEKRMAREEAGE